MAVTVTNLTSGWVDGSFTSQDTSSVSPSGNKLILIGINQRTGITENPVVPTISGNGLTWEKILSIITDSTGSSRRRLSLFRSMGASPSSGVITISSGVQTQTNFSWAVSEFGGVDTTGTNGSGAVVQSAQVIDETISTQNVSVTLSAFSNVNNATFGCFNSADATHTFTPGSGFTELYEVNDTSGGLSGGALATEWKDTNDTTVDGVWSGNFQGGGIAIEIKAAVTSNIKYGGLQMMGMGN